MNCWILQQIIWNLLEKLTYLWPSYDAEIHEINKTYRNIDRPTDVISFAIEDLGEDELAVMGLPEDMPRELGDLFISIDKTREQAADYGHSFERELGFLAVHGFFIWMVTTIEWSR